MAVVYATGNGAIRARIEASGSALALFRAGDRNRLIRSALVESGNMWLAKFYGLRFTNYVQRQPFGYPKRAVGLATQKLRNAKKGPLRDTWQRIKQREFFGWDPFDETTHRMPAALITWWIQRNPGRYRKRRALGGFGIHTRKEIRHDIRAWARKRTREYAMNLSDDGVILPNVQSGDLRSGTFGAPRSSAIATAKRARLTVTMPRGDRQNKWTARSLGTLPHWEFDAIVAAFGQSLTAGLSGALSSRIAASPDGRSVGAGAPRSAGVRAPRSVRGVA